MLGEPQWALIFGAARKRGATWDDLADVNAFKREIEVALDDGTIIVTGNKPPEVLPWADMLASITNTNAPALTQDDYERAAVELGNGVTPKHMRASKTVEAPRGAFDDNGRPSILYERHVFARNTTPKGRFNSSYPDLSAIRGYGAGGYGPFSSQYTKLQRAYALDPESAFEACSWGAFQVLGENAVQLGYASARDMACELAKSEAAHLDSYVRFIKVNGLADELGRCRAGDPESCIPFVERYNGSGFRKFSYHVKFAEALL
jgi:hypothetical protein